MIRLLAKTWWLLALCAAFDALHAAINLLMSNWNGSLILRRFTAPDVVWAMGWLALAAGACAIAAGIWNSGRGFSWLLVLHGLPLAGFGLIAVSPLVRGPLSFRPVSLLFLLMALSIGIFALELALTPGSGARAGWFLNLIGAVFLAFGISFVAVGAGWIVLRPPQAYWIWMGSYLGLCAIFMLWLALRVHGYGLRQSGRREDLPPLHSPRLAH